VVGTRKMSEQSSLCDNWGGGWPVLRLTSSLVICAVYGICIIRRRHHWSNASRCRLEAENGSRKMSWRWRFALLGCSGMIDSKSCLFRDVSCWNLMLCLEKLARVDVFEVVYLPAAEHRIFNRDCQTILLFALRINFWTVWWKHHDSMTHGCKLMVH